MVTVDQTVPPESESLQKQVRSLKDNVRCPYMLGLDLDLCSVSQLECPFQGDESYSLRSGPKKGCRRPRTLRLKKMLG